MPQDFEVDGVDEPDWIVWRGPDIPLWNHLPSAWRWRVAELVDAFNQTLPSKAPQLVYYHMNEIRSEAMPKRLKARRGITICLADRLEHPNAAAETHFGPVHDHVIRRTLIEIRSDRSPGEDPLCHEFMHVLTGIDDHDGLPHPESSCVWGHLMTPGIIDEHYLRWVYRKYASHRRRAQDRKGPSSTA